MRKYVIREPIYGAEIFLLVCLPKQYDRFVRKYVTNLPSSDEAKGSDFACYESKPTPGGRRFRSIWFEDWKNDDQHLSELTHEVRHATDDILRYVGVKPTKGAEEAFTYYQAWLFMECLKRLKKGGKK